MACSAGGAALRGHTHQARGVGVRTRQCDLDLHKMMGFSLDTACALRSLSLGRNKLTRNRQSPTLSLPCAQHCVVYFHIVKILDFSVIPFYRWSSEDEVMCPATRRGPAFCTPQPLCFFCSGLSL